MSAILVGSAAAREWYGSEVRAPENDVDYFLTSPLDEVPTHPSLRVEAKFAPEFLEHRDDLMAHSVCGIAQPDLLYTIKLSHVFWHDVRFNKTIYDLVNLRRLGARKLPDTYAWLYRTWERVHGPKPARLNLSNEAFFAGYAEAHTRQFPHDELHEIFKTGDTPKYAQLKRDPSKALLSREMFFAQPYIEQLNTVWEEAHVMAVERFILTGKSRTAKTALYSALKLLVTSASKGWFPLFIVEHWEDVFLKAKPFPQINRFLELAHA